MSWNRRARASKTKAAANISAMATEQPSSPANSSTQAVIATSPDESAAFKFTLKFRRDVWNAYTPTRSSSPPHPESASPSPKPKAGQKRKRKPSPVTTGIESVTTAPKRSPVQRQCKARLTRFHYGGPDRREGGKYRDTITLETPCLRSACTNCWTHHPHLMRSPLLTPDASPLGASASLITTNNSSNTDRSPPTQKSQRPSVDTPSPPRPSALQKSKRKLTLKLRFNNPLPSSTPTTVWRETPRQRHTVRLRLTSDQGRDRFKDVVHKQVRRHLHLERLGLHRLGRDVGSEALRKPRRRHRVGFTFDSEVGKEKYRRLMGKCLS